MMHPNPISSCFEFVDIYKIAVAAKSFSYLQSEYIPLVDGRLA